jgi:hypothetical protein
MLVNKKQYISTDCNIASMNNSALYRKFDLCIPRNETARPRLQIPTFMHLILGYINRSQIPERWEKEHYNSVLEVTRPHSFISGNT